MAGNNERYVCTFRHPAALQGKESKRRRRKSNAARGGQGASAAALSYTEKRCPSFLFLSFFIMPGTVQASQLSAGDFSFFSAILYQSMNNRRCVFDPIRLARHTHIGHRGRSVPGSKLSPTPLGLLSRRTIGCTRTTVHDPPSIRVRRTDAETVYSVHCGVLVLRHTIFIRGTHTCTLEYFVYHSINSVLLPVLGMIPCSMIIQI